MTTPDPERIAAALARFAALARSPGIFPERLTLELSYACNLACPVCPRKHVTSPPSPALMPTEQALALIGEAVAGGTTTLVPFFRGEPLLHPDLAHILAQAKRIGIKTIQMASNAVLLTPDKARALLESGLDFISFSLDTLDPDDYALRRKNADLAATLANIGGFLDLRRQMGSPIEVQVSAVDAALDEQSKRRFVEYFLPRVDRVRIYAEHSPGGVFGKLAAGTGVGFERRLPCLKVVTDMVVYADGRAGRCNHDWDPDRAEPLGDVFTQGIAAVYRGQAHAALRAWHAAPGGEGPAPCASCDYWAAGYGVKGLTGETFVKGS